MFDKEITIIGGFEMYYIEKVYSLFITKKQVNKLIILKKALISDEVSVKTLCEELNKTTTQIKQLVLEINYDADRFIDDDIFFLKENDGRLNFELASDSMKKIEVFGKIKKIYFKYSQYYQLINYLFKHRKTKIVDISEDLMFSVSYCYKLLEYIKRVFVTQKIPISVKKNADWIHISGTEACIRMYHYLFELMACDTYLNNSFISIKDPVSENYDAMDTTRAKHQLMFSIMENAISQGYVVENVETHDLELLNCMENIHDSLPIIEKLPLKNTDTIHKELVYYSFWRFLFIPEFISDDEKSERGKKLKSLNHINIVEFSEKITNKLCNKYFVDSKTLNIIFYEIVINTWSYTHLFTENFLSREILSSSQKRMTDIEQIVIESANETNFLDEEDLIYIKKLTQIIASNILFQENDLIYIAVSGINQPEYINVVKNILSKMYSHNFIQFTTNIVKADIVISDCAIGNTTKEVNFVFMDCIQKKENWEKLTLLIQSLIMEKCVYKNLTMIGK